MTSQEDHSAGAAPSSSTLQTRTVSIASTVPVAKGPAARPSVAPVAKVSSEVVASEVGVSGLERGNSLIKAVCESGVGGAKDGREGLVEGGGADSRRNPQCFECGEYGHLARECRTRAGGGAGGGGSGAGGAGGAGGGANTDADACLRCGKTGHWAKDCKLPFRETPANNSPVAANAANAANAVKSGAGGCFKCGGEGHWARDCPTNRIQQKQVDKTSMYACFRCGQKGHWSKDCSLPWRDEPLDVMNVQKEVVVVAAGRPDGREATAAGKPEAGTANEAVDVEPIPKVVAADEQPVAGVAGVAAGPGVAARAVATNDVAATNADATNADATNEDAKRRPRDDAIEMPPPKVKVARVTPAPSIDVSKLPLSMRGGGGWDVRKE